VPTNLANVVAIAAGGWHCLALKSDGTATGWGRDNHNQADIPPGLSNIVAIAAGGVHNMALLGNGMVRVWGDNTYQQTNVPAGLSNVVAIAAGGWRCLALKADGTVVAWGAGTTNSNTNLVFGQNVVPMGLTNVAQIAGGWYHSLALVESGSPVVGVQLTNPILDTSGFHMMLPTRSGRVYRLEYKNSLTDSNWTALPLVAGVAGTQELSDPTAAGAARFYRVRQW